MSSSGPVSPSKDGAEPVEVGPQGRGVVARRVGGDEPDVDLVGVGRRRAGDRGGDVGHDGLADVGALGVAEEHQRQRLLQRRPEVEGLALGVGQPLRRPSWYGAVRTAPFMPSSSWTDSPETTPSPARCPRRRPRGARQPRRAASAAAVRARRSVAQPRRTPSARSSVSSAQVRERPARRRRRRRAPCGRTPTRRSRRRRTTRPRRPGRRRRRRDRPRPGGRWPRASGRRAARRGRWSRSRAPVTPMTAVA